MKRQDTAEVALHINAYSCGFPCTPFLSSINRVFILPLNTSGPSVHSDLSMLLLLSLLARFSQLHFQSRFLQEKAAEPFFLCLEEVARSLPLIALLENVLGLLRCWNQVERALKRLEAFGYVAAKVSSPWDSTFNVFSPSDEFDPKSWYLFGRFYQSNQCKQVLVDPLELGDACKRRRVYIALINRKVLRRDIDSPAALEQTLVATLNRLKVVGSPPSAFLV